MGQCLGQKGKSPPIERDRGRGGIVNFDKFQRRRIFEWRVVHLMDEKRTDPGLAVEGAEFRQGRGGAGFIEQRALSHGVETARAIR